MPDENYGFDAACETGPAAPELRRRCAWLHGGSGPTGPTEYKFVARSVALKAGSPQTVLCKWLTCSTQQQPKSGKCGRKTLDLERPIQVLGEEGPYSGYSTYHKPPFLRQPERLTC